MMRKIAALVLALLWAAPAPAQIVGTLPFNLQNGSIADANQVMSNLNTIVAAVNANAASAGANNSITALNGLTTPLVYTSGGTSTYIGGTSSGSANAQVLASPIPSGFSLISGKSVVFTAGFTNTGPTQLSVAGTGLVNVFRQGQSGPVALSGGEISTGNLVWAIFDGVEYQIGNVSPQALVPACSVIDWVGANGNPSGYLFMNGQAVSRAVFANLFGCIAVQGVAATTTNGSTSVVVPNSNLFQPGWFVGGNNVTCNSTVTGGPDGTHITISAPAGASGATTLTIGPYPQGDCSTTFNVGNFQGRATVERDFGGTVIGSNCANAASIGSNCGSQTAALNTSNLPPYTPSGTITNGAITINNGTSILQSNGLVQVAGGTAIFNYNFVTITASQAASTFTGAAQGGTSAPFSNVQPIALVDKYIKF